tara:strand:+ start:23 stop:1066 length:1044 start_codon:yes stop_codon:yes gene_type:complete
MSLKNLSVKTKIPKLLKNKLNNKKIIEIYNKFEKSLDLKENYAVAVSGGPDSLALAFLAKIYSIKKKLNPIFLIVDHKLRSDSTNEAIKVKRLLKKNLISSEILTWKGKKPKKNIQSHARMKRFEMIYKRCDNLKINNILLGHHQDDLIENFFMRMVRGSGLKGLTSLDIKTNINKKNLLRPLLYQKKSDLVFLSGKVYNFYVEDPTNKDEKYQRARIRRLLSELEKEGLDKKKIYQTLKNLKNSNDVVNFYVKENVYKNTFFLEKNNKLILNKFFFDQPYEIVLRSLSESLKLVGRKYHPIRGKKLDRIIKDYEKNQSFRVTLGGCIIEKVNQTVIILKEHPKNYQ